MIKDYLMLASEIEIVGVAVRGALGAPWLEIPRMSTL